MTEFKLSASLPGHEDDVRSVAFTDSGSLISASRDGTVRHWRPTRTSPPAYDDTIIFQSSEFVNSLAFIHRTTAFPNGLVISGGRDTILDVRSTDSTPEQDPERLLIGHQGNICSLDSFSDDEIEYLISGSWDSSAKIWDITKGQELVTLEGHTASVWAVLAYGRDIVITGCADHKIRVFNISGRLLRTITGSTDVVRSLCRLTSNSVGGAQFASAGNDNVIRLWTLDGLEIAVLHGHDSFVYSLASLPTGELASTSEDRTVRIWRGNQCLQTITHPAISVWCVAVSENGDIATGASDRIVRVFSRESDRQADQEAIKSFDDAVKSSSIPQQQVGDINKEKLPGPEFLKTKSGTKDGQVQMIREDNGDVTAHTWSVTAQQWVSVGTVVDSAGSSGRKAEFAGKDYDYVFDVDIEDGKPPLKLPYNLSQNPWEAAQKFIADNELPMTYLDQTAQFIIQNTQGHTIGQSSALNSQPDPWGQENRYRPDTQTQETTIQKTLPQKEFLNISAANFSIISKNIAKTNGMLLEAGRKDIAFSPSEVDQFTSLLAHLETAVKQPTDSPSLDLLTTFTLKIVKSWPEANQIPGFDLLRLLAIGNVNLTKDHDLLSIIQSSDAFKSNNVNIQMLAIRGFANLFANGAGRRYVTIHFSAINELLQGHLGSSAGPVNRSVQIAAMTLCINYAVQMSSNANEYPSDEYPNGIQASAKAVSADILSLLRDKRVVDTESIYRALVALGTLLMITSVPSEELVERKDLENLMRRVEDSSKEPRIKRLAQEILTV